MFINDLNENIDNALEGIFTLNGIKLFLLLNADDRVVIGKSSESVDFTVKHLASGSQFFYHYFHGRLPVEHVLEIKI